MSSAGIRRICRGQRMVSQPLRDVYFGKPANSAYRTGGWRDNAGNSDLQPVTRY